MIVVSQIYIRPVKDPDFKYSPSGTALFKFSAAHNNRKKNKNTDQWEDCGTVFMDAVAFGDTAEEMSVCVEKGTLLKCSGKLLAREWISKKDNSKHLAFDFNIDTFEVVNGTN